MSEHMSSPSEISIQTIKHIAYPGYPETRLVITDVDSLHNLTLPDGEWSTAVNTFPSIEKQQELRDQGYDLDDFGRPLHPWLREMLSDDEVGVVTGLGEYWNWGPNRAADPIVINSDENPKVLLIKRGDTGAWALPGGFIDPNESGVEAARRELFEEAGLAINGEPTEIYNGVVSDARTTAHAWGETIAVLWRINGTPTIAGRDDAVDAMWFPINDLPIEVFGSHRIMIEQASEKLQDVSIAHTPELPADVVSYEMTTDGHMSYTRLITTHGDGTRRFIKSHDANAFTDPNEEAHSRLYLRKEKLLYDHMAKHEFAHLPHNVTLMDDRVLSMNALTSDTGWHWRAPDENIDQYVKGIFTALDNLEQIPLPDDFLDNKGPINEMFYNLGWKQYDFVNSRHRIQKLFKSWESDLRSDFQEPAKLLAQNSDILHMFATPIETGHVLTHHDFRQSNIAWHPEHGAKIIDWSWAGVGPKNADATMLLIDLHKAGHDVSKYMDRFNAGYAKLLIGFWLRHCQMPPKTAGSKVRFQQAVSAISAYDLFMKNR